LIEAYVAPAWEEHEGLWLVTIPQAHQQGAVEVQSWLEARGQILLDERYGQRRLTLYRHAPRELALADDSYTPQHLVDEQVAEGVTLVGYDQPLREIRTGRNLRMVSIWRLQGTDELLVQAGLVDASGKEVGVRSNLVALNATGTVRVRTDIPISAAVPTGRYTIRYYLVDGEGRVVDTVAVGSARVQRTVDSAVGEAQFPTDYRFGQAIRLRGYDLPEKHYRPGEKVDLTLHWRAEEEVTADYVVFVHILGERINPRTNNPLWGQVDSPPVGGKYATSVWEEGDAILDPYRVPIDAETPPGTFKLEIGLYTPNTGERLPVYDSTGQALGDHVILDEIIVR
jgi:hypothetical protein